MEKPQTVLLVEDDENDIFFFQRALEKNGLPFELQVARNGQEAEDYLRGQGRFMNRELFRFPRFIISDNTLPSLSGMTFLKWLKEHPEFHVVPTILLSGSNQPCEVLKAYDELGIHSFIMKPSGNDQLEAALALTFKYWAMCTVPDTKQENEEGRHRDSGHGVQGH
jgi:CheY-like chemotaxis protein